MGETEAQGGARSSQPCWPFGTKAKQGAKRGAGGVWSCLPLSLQTFLSPCFPAQLPAPPELVPEVNPAGAQSSAHVQPPTPVPWLTPPPGRGLSVTSAPTVLRGGWETPFHPQFPERRWEGSHPQPGNGGADVRRPHREHLWDTEQPCRALWVCSPASRQLGWSQRQGARPKVAAGGLQPPRLLGGRAPFIDFAGRQRYF